MPSFIQPFVLEKENEVRSFHSVRFSRGTGRDDEEEDKGRTHSGSRDTHNATALSTRARYRRRVSFAGQRPVVRVVLICRAFIVRHLMATRHRRRSAEWQTALPRSDTRPTMGTKRRSRPRPGFCFIPPVDKPHYLSCILTLADFISDIFLCPLRARVFVADREHQARRGDRTGRRYLSRRRTKTHRRTR